MKFITQYLKKRKAERRHLRNIPRIVDERILKHHFNTKALECRDSLISQHKFGDAPLVVSLTTYSMRIHDVHLAIESIGQQTLRPNRILLWLDADEFSLETLPQTLKMQISRGLEVRFCENLRSYKKLLPTLRENANQDVITIDDDFLYPHDLIELLVSEKHNHPDAIIGIRGHKIQLNDDGTPAPYREWDFETHSRHNGPLIFLTTGAGTLFPAGLIVPEIYETDQCLSICPNADDVWVNFMSIKYGIKRRKVSDDRPFRNRFVEIDSAQEVALNQTNVHDNQNDVQIKTVIDTFDIKMPC